MKNSISRRSFLKAVGALSAAGALAACGGSSSSSTAASSTAASAAASPFLQKYFVKGVMIGSVKG